MTVLNTDAASVLEATVALFTVVTTFVADLRRNRISASFVLVRSDDWPGLPDLSRNHPAAEPIGGRTISRSTRLQACER